MLVVISAFPSVCQIQKSWRSGSAGPDSLVQELGSTEEALLQAI